jgi:hypothetical protein
MCIQIWVLVLVTLGFSRAFRTGSLRLVLTLPSDPVMTKLHRRRVWVGARSVYVPHHFDLRTLRITKDSARRQLIVTADLHDLDDGDAITQAVWV